MWVCKDHEALLVAANGISSKNLPAQHQAAQPNRRFRAIRQGLSTAPRSITSFVRAVSRTYLPPRVPCITRIPALFSASSQ